MKSKLFSLLLLFVIVIGSVTPSYASTITLNLSLDQTSYQQGSKIYISGQVLEDGDAAKGSNPSLVIYNPSMSPEFLDQWTSSEINDQGQFETFYTLNDDAPIGTYQAKLNISDGQTKIVEFEVTENQTSNETSVNVSTEKANYYANDYVKISGQVSKNSQPLENSDVAILVTKDGNQLKADQKVTNTDGSFTSGYQLSGTAKTGTYVVKVTANGVTEKTSFTVSLREAPTSPTPTPPPSPVEPETDGESDDTPDAMDNVKEWESKKGVELEKAWTIQFSTEMDKASLTENNIFILDSDENRIQSTIQVIEDGKGVKITPKELLKGESQYTLWITKGVSSNGISLEKRIKMTFTTK